MKFTGTFVNFLYLQLLDLLTTIAGLTYGMHEINPVVRYAMGFGNPLVALSLFKLVAIPVGLICVYRNRLGLLVFANVVYSCVVISNIVNLIIFSSHVFVMNN